MEWIGYFGVGAFMFAWASQTWETISTGHCTVNVGFLLLAAAGNLSLTLYALMKSDPVFFWLNAAATVGALINLYYKSFPRTT